MAADQEKEWAEAQNITVSINLVEAAKTHLKFLAAVDKNRFLYEEHVLQRAIYRYNAFWLPLLAKHLENPVSDGPLVIPLDCEWIWHCHRLNPVRYKFDCEKLYGRLLGNDKVISSVQETSVTKTADIWSKMYPEEPFELDLNRPFSGDVLQNGSFTQKFTSYDLVSAVKRQIPFTYQISRPHMWNDLFLQEAMARYKGFLHLIKVNSKTSPQRLCTPTYDIDLMWHTHQLYPDSYSQDTKKLVGSVIQHDDTDSDRSKGGKLQNAHSETIKQWEQTFGTCYWKAGVMYRGSDAPTPVTKVPFLSHVEAQEIKGFGKFGPQIPFRKTEVAEVLLEFADVKNLPKKYRQHLRVHFSKNQTGKTKPSLGISSDFEEKQCAIFQCEPKGEFLFELMSNSTGSPKLLGSCSLSLEELSDSQTQLSVNKWVLVNLESDIGNDEPVLLHVFMSITPPTPAPQVLQLGFDHPFENDVIETVVADAFGNTVCRLQKRNVVKNTTKTTLDLPNEVYCITDSGEKHAVVECNGDCWSINGTLGSFKLQNSSGNDESLFELVGYKMVKFFYGRKLDFEFEFGQSKNKESDQDFVTAVEFSTDHPYGRAIALLNLKSGTIKATDDGIVLPGIALAFILSDSTSGCREKDDEVKGAQGFNICDPCGPKQVSAYAGLCLAPCVSNCRIKVANSFLEEIDKTPHNAGLCLAPCVSNCRIKVASSVLEDIVKTPHNAGLCLAPCVSNCRIKVANSVLEDIVKTPHNAGLCLAPCVSNCRIKVANSVLEDIVKTPHNAGLCLAPCVSNCRIKVANGVLEDTSVGVK